MRVRPYAYLSNAMNAHFGLRDELHGLLLKVAGLAQAPLHGELPLPPLVLVSVVAPPAGHL